MQNQAQTLLEVTVRQRAVLGPILRRGREDVGRQDRHRGEFDVPQLRPKGEAGGDRLHLRAVAQQRLLLQKLAIATAELAEDSDGCMRMMMVRRRRLQKIVKSLHQLAENGVQRRVEEVGSEIVDAKLERA